MQQLGNGGIARIISLLILALACGRALAVTAGGRVYHDQNENRQPDPGEPGIPGVGVSNGRGIVESDADGGWSLEIDERRGELFVIKPRDWRLPLGDDMLPLFYYIHRPQGSPAGSACPGVAPSGPLPSSIDFPLYAQPEPEQFRVILFADPQPRNQREIDYITHDVLEELIGFDAAFGVTLGDITHNDLSLFESLADAVAQVGIPWHNVLGNHDVNRDTFGDRDANETFLGTFGPACYSFNYGPAHFIALDNIDWIGRRGDDDPRYRPGLGPDQLEFIRNDLARVPEDRLVVLLMHIPLTRRWNEPDREELLRLIQDRPACLSISGHAHEQAHHFIGREHGFMGPKPHHHMVNAAVSGSWWSGEPDERGIPHATMGDGAPNGYSILSIDGNHYKTRFKAASREEDFQMNIWAPEETSTQELPEAEVWVNVFGGSEKSQVDMRVDRGAWVPLNRVAAPDPYYARLKAREKQHPVDKPFRKLRRIRDSHHLWRGWLPTDLPPGPHRIEVRSVDMFGQKDTGVRIFRVMEPGAARAEPSSRD